MLKFINKNSHGQEAAELCEGEHGWRARASSCGAILTHNPSGGNLEPVHTEPSARLMVLSA